MKVHFSNVDFNSRSGPNTFASRLASCLQNRGYEFVGPEDDYETFVAFIEPASFPRAGAKFIQRLDGIWFSPEEFHTKNKGIRWTYDNCNYVIWQTQFDKNMTLHHWGDRSGHVVANGIELKEHRILDENLKKLRSSYDKVFVCSSNWHGQKRLKANTDLFLKYEQEHPEEKCVLIVMGNNPDYTLKKENILYTGNMPHELCLQVFYAADWMIHLAWLDHCPNVVVEALSQNCPVICSSSGGTKEIVRKSGIIVPEIEEYDYRLTDYTSPPKIDISNIDIPNSTEVDNWHLNIEVVADRYESILRGQWV